MILFRTGAATHEGRIRPVNQDALLESMALCIVADGMGGAAAGDVASRLAVATIARAFEQRSPSASALREGVAIANRAVYDESLTSIDLAGMGTTVTAFAPVADPDLGDHVAIVNVGDSRCYLFADGVLHLLTRDHTVAAELVRTGELSPAQAARHSQRHVLTRALGVEPEVEVDCFELPLAAGDRLLLCSDGLTNELDATVMSTILGDLRDPSAAAGALVEAALFAGGHDNVTALVVDVLVGDPTAGDRHLDAIAELAGAITTPPAADDHTAAVPAVRPLEPEPEPATIAVPVVGTAAAPTLPAPHGDQRPKRPRPITFRTVLFLGAIAAMLVAGYRFVQWFASSQYYVTTDGTALVVYQGQPGGTLWITPKLVATSKTTTAQILPSRMADLAVGVPEPSIAAANTYIANLVLEATAAKNPGVVVTTTTLPAFTTPSTSTTSTPPATTAPTTASTTTTSTTTTTSSTTTTAAG